MALQSGKNQNCDIFHISTIFFGCSIENFVLLQYHCVLGCEIPTPEKTPVLRNKPFFHSKLAICEQHTLTAERRLTEW